MSTILDIMTIQGVRITSIDGHLVESVMKDLIGREGVFCVIPENQHAETYFIPFNAELIPTNRPGYFNMASTNGEVTVLLEQVVPVQLAQGGLNA